MCYHSGLSVFGAMQMAQCKWCNAFTVSFRVRFRVRNRVRVRVRVRIRVGVGLGIGLGSGFDYCRHCAICLVPNTESHHSVVK